MNYKSKQDVVRQLVEAMQKGRYNLQRLILNTERERLQALAGIQLECGQFDESCKTTTEAQYIREGLEFAEQRLFCTGDKLPTTDWWLIAAAMFMGVVGLWGLWIGAMKIMGVR